MVNEFLFNLEVNNKKDLLKLLAKKLVENDVFINEEEVYNMLLERENDISTGMGMKIAMPHLQTSNNKKDVIYFFDLVKPIDFDSIDNIPVQFGFLIISRIEKGDHLEKLSKLSLFLLNETNYDTLLNDSKEKIKAIIMEELC